MKLLSVTKRTLLAKARMTAIMMVVAIFTMGAAASASPTPWSQGFEQDISGWDVFNASFWPERVSSGTNDIVSSSGSWHAELAPGANADGQRTNAATNWGGYSSSFGDGYITRLDIYLDVDNGWSNDTRFDFTSAINNPDGDHRRDFVFNIGFYDDSSGPGADTDRFIISAGTNAGRANAYPKNPGGDPVAVSETGWYTFEHVFYDAGGGVMAVDLNIWDSADVLINSWTLSDASDVIGTTVGGNRYGWVANNEFSVLAIDNAQLIPEPASLALLGLGGLLMLRRRRQA